MNENHDADCENQKATGGDKQEGGHKIKVDKHHHFFFRFGSTTRSIDTMARRTHAKSRR